jgi:hypothetical protein
MPRVHLNEFLNLCTHNREAQTWQDQKMLPFVEDNEVTAVSDFAIHRPKKDDEECYRAAGCECGKCEKEFFGVVEWARRSNVREIRSACENGQEDARPDKPHWITARADGEPLGRVVHAQVNRSALGIEQSREFGVSRLGLKSLHGSSHQFES